MLTAGSDSSFMPRQPHDNHMSYRRSHSFARLLRSRQIHHIRTRPYTPRRVVSHESGVLMLRA
jgi:hypothetical protein